MQEALAQEDLSQSEFSSVLDSLHNVARDTNVKVRFTLMRTFYGWPMGQHTSAWIGLLCSLSAKQKQQLCTSAEWGVQG
jgi:hypothetical protein